MKRRTLLAGGVLGMGLLAGWSLRPGNQGQPHTPYFARLNQLLRHEGGGVPLMVLDLDRLESNAAVLSHQLGDRLPLRLVAKSLTPPALLEYLSKRLVTQRFMVFHQPQINQLAQNFPLGDLLLGKPLPAAAALRFYQHLPADTAFNPAKQLTWLIDSMPRMMEYAALADALEQPLQIAFEIDVGLARGGFTTPDQLLAAFNWLRSTPNRLNVRGLMGYDAHVAQPPLWVSRNRAFTDSTSRYRAFIACAAGFTDLWPEQPTLNGAGSLTYPLHARTDTPLNEVSVGSALLKPSDFESDLLHELQTALWIASPVLKALPGQLPFVDRAQSLLQLWNPNRQQSYYLYGGQWPAKPVSPPGLSYDALYGRSANQERLIGSAKCDLSVDDWVFMRPQRSEGVFEMFSQLHLLRSGQLVGRWQTQEQRK